MMYAFNGKYPIETKDQLEKTSSYFDRYLQKFHPKDRVIFSTAIEKRANYLGVETNRDWVKNYARALSNPSISPDFNRNMDLRKVACANSSVEINGKNIKASDIIDTIKSNIEKIGAYATVDCIFAFDKTAGIEPMWDKAIVDPIITVFGSLRDPSFSSGKMSSDDLEKKAFLDKVTLSK